MTLTPWLLALPLVALAAIPAWRAARMRRRRAFIEAYRFAPHLRAQVLQTWPNLHPGALNDVERGLRQFFRVSLAARGHMVADIAQLDAIIDNEGLDPRRAAALPLMFELDTTLAIPGGFRYEPDCSRPGSSAWCGNALGCGSTGCGSSHGSDGGDAGGDGGGDGGGCGGGGD